MFHFVKEVVKEDRKGKLSPVTHYFVWSHYAGPATCIICVHACGSVHKHMDVCLNMKQEWVSFLFVFYETSASVVVLYNLESLRDCWITDHPL